MSHVPEGVIPWILSMLRPLWRQVLLAAVALLIGAGTWLALGQGIRLAVDQGFSSGSAEALNRVMIGLLFLGAVGGFATYIRFYFMTWLGERVCADIRRQVYAHLLTLSSSFYQSTRTGEVIARFTADTTVLQNVVGMSLSMALRSTVTFIGGLLLMLFTSAELTAYVLVAVPLVLIPIRLLGGRVRRYARLSQDRVADIGAQVDESLHAIHTVQAYTHESQDQARFDDKVDAVLDVAAKRIRYRGGLFAGVMMLSISAITLVGWRGAHQVLDGTLSAGELTSFMFYAVICAGAVATLSEVIGEIQRAAGAGERLLELLHQQPEIRSAEAATSVARAQGHLSLEDVSFAYPTAPDTPVLQHLNLFVHPGERVALVGPSGAGKSTVFKLLQRFYQPQSGRIALDGEALDSLELASLRNQFASVPQEPVIFATSALENIRYGRTQATKEEVVAAARAAQAHEFIEALPGGYLADLGERGVKLSGGQKQRIAIARAILADRPILLLDEATSALDAGSEHLVQKALARLMVGRTSLIIAHRLATVMEADRILVLDRGQVVAMGTHAELMLSSDLYRELAELQFISAAVPVAE